MYRAAPAPPVRYLPAGSPGTAAATAQTAWPPGRATRGLVHAAPLGTVAQPHLPPGLFGLVVPPRWWGQPPGWGRCTAGGRASAGRGFGLLCGDHR
jgi:hypothetical protein